MSAHVELDAINAEIAMLEARHDAVKGSSCEVYSRIVGYYRSLGNWNQGKREEFEERKTFDMPKGGR